MNERSRPRADVLRSFGEAMPKSPIDVRCDLCGTSESVPVAIGRRFDIAVHFVACRACGLVYQRPRMPAEQLSIFYDTLYRDLYSGSNEIPTAEFLADQESRGRRILEFCRPWLVSGSQVLDVGCGAGATLIPFRDAGHRVVGIEPGPYATWGARHLGLDIRRASVDDLLISGLAPDVMLFSYVLEHVPAPRAVLTASHRSLGDDGLVFIEVPNLMRLRGPVDQYFHVAHLTYFTPKTLLAMLEGSGFRPVAIDAGRSYSMRVLARRTSSDASSSDPRGRADDPIVISRLVRRHSRIARIEFGSRAMVMRVLRPMAGLSRIILGNDRTERLITTLRRTARRARYGEES